MMTEPSVLPGQLLSVLVLGALLSYPLTRWLLARYGRAVERAMRRPALATATAPTAAPLPRIPPPARVGSAPALSRHLRQLPWLAAGREAGIAVLVALWFSVCHLQAADLAYSAWRVAALAATFAWPGVLAVLLVAGISARQRRRTLGLGSAAYLAYGVLANVGPPLQALGETCQLWALYNLVPTLYLGAFLTPRVRHAGPLVMVACLAAAGGMVGTFALLNLAPALGRRAALQLFELGFGAHGALAVFALTGAAFALGLGFALLHWLAAAYARFRLGDQGLTLAALWLTFTLFYSVFLLTNGGGDFALGLLGFPLYLVLSRYAPRAGADPHTIGQPPPGLLLLRVFARGGPATTLFRTVSRHWRYVGPIRLIAGYDLATEAIEPDEIMAFVRGRLADSFVTTPNLVRQRLTAAPARRDPDGRYRSEEFFCFDDTWRDTLRQLVATSTVVLMDLRGFGAGNSGCRFELEALDAAGALSRTVFLTDPPPTDAPLRAALLELGIALEALHCVPISGREETALAALMEALAARAAA